MTRARSLGRLSMVSMLVCMMAIAAASPASAHVAPPDSAWSPLVTFGLLNVFGRQAANVFGTFAVNQCDPSTAPFTPFGLAAEGIASVEAICAPPNFFINGGHAESWVESFCFPGSPCMDGFGTAVGGDVASVNAFMTTSGFVQFNAKLFVFFTYGASAGDGSFGQIFPNPPCAPPRNTEGFLVLSIYAQQVFNPDALLDHAGTRGAFENGELLYCSFDPSASLAALLANGVRGIGFFDFVESCQSYFTRSGGPL